MKKFFGTDGIRGQSNIHPMTAEIALRVGMAAAVHLSETSLKSNRVVIGKDTRLSGYMFESALVAGLTSIGKHVILLGPVPTPAVAMLTSSMRADLGVMISASHNPYYDNGIKLFDSKGFKLSDNDEHHIEELLHQDLSNYLVKSDQVGRVERLKESVGRYIQHIKMAVPLNINFKGLKIVVDCANGGAYRFAPAIFYELEAEVIELGVKPNGININDKCGSTYIETLRLKVLESGADLGIAFDGDADRIIAVDEKGNILNGDKILAVIATKFKQEGLLNNNKVATTVMSNMAFSGYLKSKGIDAIQTSVGDRYVSEAIKEHNLSLGGEQSGHIIIPSYSTTGDGILAGILLVCVLVTSNTTASICLNPYEESPQVLSNIRYNSSNPLENAHIKNFINDLQNKHKNCRILVRKSGTERLIRIMVEGDDKAEIKDICLNIETEINKTSV